MARFPWHLRRGMTRPTTLRRHHPRRRQGHADEIRRAQGAAPDRRPADARSSARRASTALGAGAQDRRRRRRPRAGRAAGRRRAAARSSSRSSSSAPPTPSGRPRRRSPASTATSSSSTATRRWSRPRRWRGCSSGCTRADAPAVVVRRLPARRPGAYGRILADADGTIEKMVEYKDATRGGARGRPVQFGPDGGRAARSVRAARAGSATTMRPANIICPTSSCSPPPTAATRR